MPKKKTKNIHFHDTPLYKRREPHALSFLSQRSSFWLATLTIFSFVVGNMVGQHGWYAFWASVMGRESDAYIVYTGTVSPIQRVPNYVAWASYGGTSDDHTYRQVPRGVLTDLPLYNPRTQHKHMEVSSIGQIYSVGYNGSYKTGGEHDGSHPGVDIRVPVGTPVHAIANGVVMQARDRNGFGNTIVIRHSNVPDPANPSELTTLYSSYAHLSSMYVEAGDVVRMGAKIALSGNTGLTSGPHLHFQIDREEAPWHPYWPFSGTEAREAGLSMYQAVNAGLHSERVKKYTVHPMLYVQANYQPIRVLADASERLHESTRDRSQSSSHHSLSRRARAPTSRASRVARLRNRRAERARQRLSRQRYTAPIVQKSDPVVVHREEVVSASLDSVEAPHASVFKDIEIVHDGTFTGREWETLRISLHDKDGDRVDHPLLETDLHLRTAYGSAEFRPAALTAESFRDGVAEVKMLPRGRRTIVIQVQPHGAISKPIKYKR